MEKNKFKFYKSNINLNKKTILITGGTGSFGQAFVEKALSLYKPKKLIILLHGYGDHAENFIPLTKYFNDNTLETNYFAPNAPFVVPQYPSGRQWFNPYPNGIHYNEAGPQEQVIMQQECETSIKLLEEYINKLCSLNNLSHQDCFLIGFSPYHILHVMHCAFLALRKRLKLIK